MVPSRCFTSLLALSILTFHAIGQFAGKYEKGVALGGWLLLESWMYPLRWQQMGGERCDSNAASCVTSEWALVHKLGQAQANEVFLNHWKTWFTQEHVDRIKAVNLDHVKIPLGFWIIEELVQGPGEMYAQGGWMELKRGLRQLKTAGLNVVLTMHALPGVSASNQLFAGNYTEEMHFYEDPNYQRALTWIVILTAMSHLDPDFERVLGIFFINEPNSDADKTPGLGTYYRDAITTVRVIEYGLGIACDVNLEPALERMAAAKNVLPGLQAAIPLLAIYAAKADPPLDVSALTDFLNSHAHNPISSPPDEPSNYSSQINGEYSFNSSSATIREISQTSPSSLESHTVVPSPLADGSSENPNNPLLSLPLNSLNRSRHSLSSLSRRQVRHGLRSLPKLSQSQASEQSYKDRQRFCLTTIAMPKRWQYKGPAESMAPHVLGPRAYDDHLYFSFGGIADASYDSYLDHICSWNGYEISQNNSEIPCGTGEFSLATNFNDTPSQLRDWGDAQKFLHAKESFWTFWTFRIEEPTDKDRVKTADQWSYLRAVDQGLLPNHPEVLFNASICAGRTEKKNV